MKCSIFILDPKNKTNPYIKEISPLAMTNGLGSAKEFVVNYNPIDDDEVYNFSQQLELLAKTTDNTDWEFEIWNYPEKDIRLAEIKLSENSNWIVSINIKATEEQIRSLHVLIDEIGDYYNTTLLTLAYRKAKGVVTSASSITSTSTSTSTSNEEIEALIEKIKAHTKADITKPKETLADYLCTKELKAELEEIVDFFANSKAYSDANIVLPKGVLFKGAPGTGKTFAAKCIAGSVDCYFMSCTASSLQGMYIGSGAENIRQVFKGAKNLHEASKKGVIVFIDELDSFGNRDSHSGSSSGEEDRTLNQLLAEMSGFEDTEGIMVLGATNYANRLDDALTRAGRFSRHITINYPEALERKALIEHYFGKIKLSVVGSDWDEITELTKGFTPADIQEMCNEAAILAIRNKSKDITLDFINEAINKTITKDIRKPDKDADFQRRVAAHEVGHVLAEIIHLGSVPIKVTNYSYGDAGGFTQPAFTMEGIISKPRYEGYIYSLLGGRAAELALGWNSTGASDDLRRAKKLIEDYFKVYHFEEDYDIEKLDQMIHDKLWTMIESLVTEFKSDSVRDILQKMTNELITKRVLYSTQIGAIAAPLIKIV